MYLIRFLKKKKKTGQKFSLLAKQLYGVLNLEELDFELKIFFTKNLLSLDFHNLKKKCYKEKSKDLEIRQGFPLLPQRHSFH